VFPSLSQHPATVSNKIPSLALLCVLCVLCALCG
jgi:hypothetical protein